ncbi:MAG: DUF3365 domain-containing protein [Prochloron sp. SP5CPC1]|nr:DUF3365 domain-containing protein [Candidatus Paraprochloron terpiosi SP5CPC1]
MVQKFVDSVLPKKGLLGQFRRVLIGLYVVTLVVTILSVNVWTRHEVNVSSRQELNLLIDMMKANSTYVEEDMIPYLLPRGIVHLPAVSFAVATKRIAEHFLKIQPDYYIKLVSDNPLNPQNLPYPLEETIIERFRTDKSLKKLVEKGKIEDNNYLVYSTPSVSQESCLQCHGVPEKAPREVVEQYGTNSGYGYTIGQVVGANFVAVPLTNINSLILKRSLVAVGLLTLLFSGIFILMDRLVQRFVLKPVINMARVARSVSEGLLEEEVSVRSEDEIGELAHAVELMRRSLVTATNYINRLSRNKKD